MSDKATINSKLYQLVNVDTNSVPVSIPNKFYLPPTGTFIGAVKADGTTTTIAADGTITATSGGTVGVASLAVNTGGTPRTGALKLLPGTNVTLLDNTDGTFTINSTGGGGSGTVTSVTTNINGFTFGLNLTTTPVLAIQNAGATPANNFFRGDGTWVPVISSLAVGASGTTRTGGVKFIAGNNVTIVDNADGTFTWNATGGGGGTALTSTSLWTTANATSKNAYSSYTSPAVNTINNDGITLNLVASTGFGVITNCTISLNGTALTGTYNSTGSFPNYQITIPTANLVGNAAETAATVTIGILGTFAGASFNITSTSLTNNQPIPFTTVLTVAYTRTTVPYYAQTSTVTWSYSNSAQITTFGGNVVINSTPTNFTSPSGTTASLPSTGGTIGGSATGFGLNGAQSSTVSFSGTLAAVPSYIPAFYFQPTAGNTPPNFATAPASNLQSTGAALGSIFTYTLSTSASFYGWIAIPNTLALSNIYIRTSGGDFPLVPDITAPNQTVAGQVYLVFGFTNFSLVQTLTLVIK